MMKIHETLLKNAHISDVLRCVSKENVNSEFSFGQTPLHLVSRHTESPRILPRMLLLGGDVTTIDDDGETPLHTAVRNAENSTLPMMLISAKADPNAMDLEGNTPLHYAAKNEDVPNLLRTLFDFGADISIKNAKEETPLDVACSIRHKEILKELAETEKGKLQFKQSQSVWNLAFESDWDGVIQQLKQDDNVFNSRCFFKGVSGMSLLHVAIENTADLEVISFLISKGIDINSPATNRFTPLRLAVEKHSESIVQILLENGADANMDILHAAVACSDLPSVLLLLHWGASADLKDSKGLVPLQYLSNSVHKQEIVEALVNFGADINVQNDEGETILHRCLRWKPRCDLDFVRFLINAGADVLQTDKHGRMAHQIIWDDKEGWRDGKYWLWCSYSTFPCKKYKLDDVCCTLFTTVYGLPDQYPDEAIRKGDLESVRCWLENGPLERKTELASDFLSYAIEFCRPSVNELALFLDHGAEIHFNLYYGFESATTILHQTIRSGLSPETVKYLADRFNTCIDEKDYGGNTPLNLLIEHKYDWNTIRYFVNKGAVLDAESLHLAIKNGNCEAEIEYILDRGVNVNAKGKDDCTPLHTAILYRPDISLVNFLGKHGADFNTECKPLHLAFDHHRDFSFIKSLIENGADVNAKAMGIIRYHNNSADFDDDGSVSSSGEMTATPLHLAVAQRYGVSVVRYLVEKGARINAYTRDFDINQSKRRIEYFDQETPLHVAIRNNSHPETICLLELGADTTPDSVICKRGFRTTRQGEALLYMALRYSPDLDIVKVLMKHGVDVRFMTASSWLMAAENNAQEVVEYLLESGANINARRMDYDTTALHEAIVEGVNLEAIEFLLKCGIDVNAKAASWREVDEWKIPVRNVEKKEDTALHLAVIHKSERRIIEVLLNNGADATLLNSKGETPCSLAMKDNPNSVVSRILQAKMLKTTHETETPLLPTPTSSISDEAVQRLGLSPDGSTAICHESCTDDDIYHYLSGMTNMCTINLEGRIDPNLSLYHIQGLNQIHSLKIQCGKAITDKGVFFLKGFSCLKSLELRLPLGITEKSRAYFEEMQQIEKIELSDITDFELKQISCIKNLRELRLYASRSISDIGLSFLKNLTSLDVFVLNSSYECKKITDGGLSHLGSLVQLKKLSLEACNNITDNGLKHFEKLTQLHELSLNSCDQITDMGLKHLENLNQLQYLSLSWCDKISKNGLTELQNTLPTLRINSRTLNIG